MVLGNIWVSLNRFGVSLRVSNNSDNRKLWPSDLRVDPLMSGLVEIRTDFPSIW